MDEIFKRPYRVRKAALRGKEITLAPETPFRPGDEIIQLFDGFVLIVAKGTVINESLLRRAISAPKKRGETNGQIQV